MSKKNRDVASKACDFCNTKKGKLRLCGNCKRVTYCSRKCQKAGWSMHKLVCCKNKSSEHVTIGSKSFSAWNWLANAHRGVACRVASLLVRIEISREKGLSSTSSDVGRVLMNLRAVSRDWRDAIDNSMPWTGAKRFYYCWWKNKPLIYSVAEARQIKLLNWCIENLSHKESPSDVDSVAILSKVFASRSSKRIDADMGDFQDRNPHKGKNHESWYVNSTTIECVKAVHNNKVRRALGEPLIESVSQIEFLRSSKEFPLLVEHLGDIGTLKWVIKNWNLTREDFLLSSRGVMDRKTLDCAKYLQSRYNFNAYEALGHDLRVLGSWCGDARNLTFIQWYVSTYKITKSMFQAAGSTFAYVLFSLRF